MKRTIAITASSGMGKSDTLVKLAIAESGCTNLTIIYWEGERTFKMLVDHMQSKSDLMGLRGRVNCVARDTNLDEVEKFLSDHNNYPNGIALFVDEPAWTPSSNDIPELAALVDHSAIVYYTVQARRKGNGQ